MSYEKGDVVAKKNALWRLFYIVPLGMVFFWLTFFLFNYFTDNFHTVVAGELYRSRQLSAEGFDRAIDHYQIRTVVNLRGASPKADWYQEEMLAVQSRGVVHYDLHLKAHSIPTHNQLKQLVSILKSAPKPILVHCREGADRTGLMSAMGVILLGNIPLHRAAQQISWRYNVLSPHTIGYQTLRNYFTWLDRHERSHSKANFVQWVNADTKLEPYHGVFLF